MSVSLPSTENTRLAIADAPRSLRLTAIIAGLIGFMLQKLNIVLRLVSVAAGLMMIHPGALTDVIGIAILIAILAYQVISEKRHAATA